MSYEKMKNDLKMLIKNNDEIKQELKMFEKLFQRQRILIEHGQQIDSMYAKQFDFMYSMLSQEQRIILHQKFSNENELVFVKSQLYLN